MTIGLWDTGQKEVSEADASFAALCRDPVGTRRIDAPFGAYGQAADPDAASVLARHSLGPGPRPLAVEMRGRSRSGLAVAFVSSASEW